MNEIDKKGSLKLTDENDTENRSDVFTDDEVNYLKNLVDKDPEEVIKVINSEIKSVKISHSSMFMGPLPSPSSLKGYGEIDPSFPDRIFKLTENDQVHRIELENYAIRENMKFNKMGMWFGFIIAILSICIGAFLIYNDKNVAGIAAIFTSLVGVIAVFILNQKNEKKDEDNKNN